MQTIKTNDKIQRFVEYCKNQQQTISLVPTMGGLHAGHLALVDLARQKTDCVVVSIFVNPAQFSEDEDFDSYPRDLENDLILLQKHQVDAVFLPTVELIYPKGARVNIDLSEWGRILCAKTRPHFFVGVAQAVYRLFEIIQPDVAVFGQKDYQQLMIIKRMASQYFSQILVISHTTIREKNGLAISTRNQYLSVKNHKIAANFYKILTAAKLKIQQNQPADKVKKQAQNQLKIFFELDYIEILDANTLKQISNNTKQISILSAVFLDSIRLIDNIQLGR